MTAKEPRVLAQDVQAILEQTLGRDPETRIESLPALAERAGTTPRTVQRILSGKSKTVGLALGDRICIACGVHLSECRIVLPDGTIEGDA